MTHTHTVSSRDPLSMQHTHGLQGPLLLGGILSQIPSTPSTHSYLLSAARELSAASSTLQMPKIRFLGLACSARPGPKLAVTSPSCTAGQGMPLSFPLALQGAWQLPSTPTPVPASSRGLALGLSGPLYYPHWCSQHLTI